MTTRVIAVSWRAVYYFAEFGRVDFGKWSHSGWTKRSHLYVIKLSLLCQPWMPSNIQNPIQKLDYAQICFAQKASISQKKKGPIKEGVTQL